MFQSKLANIEKYHNDDVKSAFERASLRMCEARDLRLNYPAVSNLLCYIAIETLANIIEYFRITKAQKITDFIVKTGVEKSINKTDVFINFFSIFCPEDLKSQIQFKKHSLNDVDKIYDSDFKDFLRYLYVKNRCYIVHKGLFRYFEDDCSWGDIFIDAKGKKCFISVTVSNNEWVLNATTGCFLNFLKDPTLIRNGNRNNQKVPSIKK